MKNVPIRTRLLAMLALPVVALAVAAGINVRRAGDQLDMARRQHEQAEITAGPASLVGALQDERNYAAVWMLGWEGLADLRAKDNSSARATTDKLLSEFRRRLEATEPEVRQAYRGALISTEELIGQIRARVDSTDRGGDQSPKAKEEQSPKAKEEQFSKAEGVFDDYSDLIVAFHNANDRSLELIADTQLRSMGRSLAFQSRASDLQAQIPRDVAVAYMAPPADDQAPPADDEKWVSIAARIDIAKKRANHDYFQQRSIDLLAESPSTQKVVEGWINRPLQKVFSQQLETILQSGIVTFDGLMRVVDVAGDESHPNSFDAGDATVEAMQARSNKLIAAAEADRTWNLILLTVTIVGSLGGAFLVARGLTRPIKQLTEEAHLMATETLPATVASVLETPVGEDIAIPELAPMPTSSVTEVAELATALNSVQSSALGLAVEQAGLRHNSADSLVNLGRRVQGLVGRQIEVLDQLEQTEPEIERLNELYQADHLATRIRRNAESLIVLAGSTKVQRRTSFGPPVAVESVVRSAVTEVEQFERVVLGDLGTSEVSGQVAKDVAHLLAELLENGLAFSPPTTDVAVSGRLLKDGSYQIRLDDAGIGLRPEAMEEANARLHGLEAFNTTPSKYLGHYVVGHLAQRHGITVDLAENDNDGVSAKVVIPAALISAPRPKAEPVPTTEPAPVIEPAAHPEPGAEAEAEAEATERVDLEDAVELREITVPAEDQVMVGAAGQHQDHDSSEVAKPWTIGVTPSDHPALEGQPEESTFGAYVHANRSLHDVIAGRRELDAEVR
ncbi:MAG: sensor histidine kinase [Microthrixaceae bacterium]|nr:sensor histidine kinase [Acidimicrobiales bacterium]MCB9403967.1 sensor histidine kinase [Microthrixaceae bacterium]